MTTALLVLAGILIVAAFIGGIFVGRATLAAPASAATPAPTHTGEDAAAQSALDASKKKAEEVLHETDASVRADVERLRSRGRSGE